VGQGLALRLAHSVLKTADQEPGLTD
jgi:hypothetical protein